MSSTNTPLDKMTSSQNLSILVGVIICFILSGFAALVYQTAWMRQFSLVFGTSELAVAAVLSAYMAGLALGANLAARFVDRIKRPVLYYGVLEAGIAISALAVPLFLTATSWLYVSMLGGQPQPASSGGAAQSAFYLALAFLILLIPTAFMGATLPLLTKYAVRSKEQIGSRVGMLYSFNTLGAIAGTLTAGFILLPLAGLKGTVYVGVAVNFLVFLIAIKIARQADELSQQEAQKEADISEPSADKTTEVAAFDQVTARWILPLMLLSGSISFVYEVLWTRLLGHVLGGSVIAFSTMLAGFLSGIALGSAIASRFAATKSQAMSLFVICQIGIAMMSIAVYQALPGLVPEGTAGIRGNVLMALSVLLPSTLFIGATFPLAVRILAQDRASAAPASARVYSWNTVGAIFGATVAAFIIIPALKYEGTIKLAVLANLSLAALVSFFVLKDKRGPQKNTSSLDRFSLPVALVFFIGTFFLYQPLMPEKVLRSSPVHAVDTGEVTFYEVGRSATVLMIDGDDYSSLRTNGLPEASILLKGSPPVSHSQHMLSITPVLIRPEIESMLIVGLGGGVALEGVPRSVDSIDVIELEPQVINANLAVSEQRQWDPLSDERINLIENDARSALSLTDKKYQAIVSQPSHPWTAGASHLYTREFMQLADRHLTDDGVFLQWMNSQFVDEALLRSLTATMLEVFPYIRMYQWSPEALFLIGSREPMQPEMDLLRTGLPLSNDPLAYLEKGVGSVEDLIVALVMDQESAEEFARDSALITDNNNLMANRSARVMNTDQALRLSRLSLLLKDYDPLLAANSDLRSGLSGLVDYAYVARRLEALNFKQRAIDLADSLLESDPSMALQIVARGQQNQGETQEAERNLVLSFIENPENQQARFMFLQPWFDEYLQNLELPEVVAAEFSYLTGTARSVLDAWLAIESSDFRAAAALDSELAKVLPTDVWYEASVKLRVGWRLRVSTPELQQRFAEESVRLIDSAIVFERSTDLFAMRLQASLALADVDKVLQTALQLNKANSNIIAQVENGVELSAARFSTMLQQERLIEALLVDLLIGSTADQIRVDRLLANNQQALGFLTTLVPGN